MDIAVMSADKRSFCDFDQFPGSINLDTNQYEFPKLFKMGANDKIREWAVYIRLITKDSQNVKETKQQNWNALIENKIPIHQEYITDTKSFPDGALVELWTETGIKGMKISRSAVTYIKGKLIGKANERNPLQQALVAARGKWMKKVDEGSTSNLEEVTTITVSQDSGNIMYYPMLAKN